MRNLYVCASEYLAVASQPTPTTLLLGVAYMYYNTENQLQALNKETVQKITTTATTKNRHDNQDIQRKIIQGPKRWHFGRKLTTMQRTWTNTDTYGTVFEILKSWDPSTKLDSSKDQWKYTHTMHIWRTREKEAQGIIAQTAKRAFGDRKKKENGEQGMRMCVRKQWWNAQGPNVLTWLQVEITWGSMGVEQQRSLRFLFLRCIAAQMVSPVWSQACAFCAGLAAVSAPEPEVPLEPSMEGH